MSYRCPKCNGIIYDRRNSVCGFCGAELPANLLLTPSEMAALDKAAGGAEQDDAPPIEPASNRLAAFLRDCILGPLIVLAMVVWLLYFAVTAIVTGHLYIQETSSRRWTPKPLDGLPAELVGFSFLSLAVTFILVCATHPRVVAYMPSWARVSYWWFFAGWAILYFTAMFIS